MKVSSIIPLVVACYHVTFRSLYHLRGHVRSASWSQASNAPAKWDKRNDYLLLQLWTIIYYNYQIFPVFSSFYSGERFMFGLLDIHGYAAVTVASTATADLCL